jgi:hypothetical protein
MKTLWNNLESTARNKSTRANNTSVGRWFVKVKSFWHLPSWVSAAFSTTNSSNSTIELLLEISRVESSTKGPLILIFSVLHCFRIFKIHPSQKQAMRDRILQHDIVSHLFQIFFKNISITKTLRSKV